MQRLMRALRAFNGLSPGPCPALDSCSVDVQPARTMLQYVGRDDAHEGLARQHDRLVGGLQRSTPTFPYVRWVAAIDVTGRARYCIDSPRYAQRLRKARAEEPLHAVPNLKARVLDAACHAVVRAWRTADQHVAAGL